MIVYWFLFLFFAIGALLERPKSALEQRFAPGFWIGGALIAAVIGFRYHVGGDWTPYAAMLSDASAMSFQQAGSLPDPGYVIINWAVAQIGGRVWVVNLICGAIFSWGLLRFAQVQERPWLAVLIAIPYLVTVVAMGYTRQSVSIGLVMAGFASYVRRGSVLRFVIYGLIAASFHKSAVVTMPLIAFGDRRSTVVNLLITAGATYFLYEYFLSQAVDLFVINYLESSYASEGAGVRIAMSSVPAFLYLFRSRAISLTDRERRIWRNFSIAALMLVPTLVILPSSTTVDRLALYVLPIQMVVLSRPRMLRVGEQFGVLLAIAYSATILMGWLLFAVHARFWIPYRFWPLS